MSRRGENIYKRKDGRWEGRYPKGRLETGKIKYGYVYGHTYQETKQKLYPLKIKYQTLIQLNGKSAFPLYQWVNQWLVEIQGKVKPATYASYQYKMDHYILPTLAENLLNELDEEKIKEIVAQWRTSNLSHSTIRVLFQVLNNCLSFAVKKGILKTNPCEAIYLPIQQKRRIQALSKREQNALEGVVKEADSKKGLPITLALQTGMRIGEIAALQWKNIDFDLNVIYVEQTFQRVSYFNREKKQSQLVLSSPKTVSSKRIIPMTKFVRKTLLKEKKKRTGDFVFSVNGHPCEPRLINYHFQKLAKKAQVIGKHFHQLRHTFATRCVEKNRDIASVSALLGHASTQMTLDTYSSALIEQRMKIIQSLD